MSSYGLWKVKTCSLVGKCQRGGNLPPTSPTRR